MRLPLVTLRPASLFPMVKAAAWISTPSAVEALKEAKAKVTPVFCAARKDERAGHSERLERLRPVGVIAGVVRLRSARERDGSIEVLLEGKGLAAVKATEAGQAEVEEIPFPEEEAKARRQLVAVQQAAQALLTGPHWTRGFGNSVEEELAEILGVASPLKLFFEVAHRADLPWEDKVALLESREALHERLERLLDLLAKL